MKLYRKEKLVEKLLRFGLKKKGFSLFKVECYNRFDGDKPMCRFEIFLEGISIYNRILKHEAHLDTKFILEVENKLKGQQTGVGNGDKLLS